MQNAIHDWPLRHTGNTHCMTGAALSLPMNHAEARSAAQGDGFACVERDGVTWTMRADLVDRVLPTIQQIIAGRPAPEVAETVKTGPHRSVYRLLLPGGEFYLKHFRIADWKALLQNVVRPSKAEREWRAAHAHRRAGLADLRASRPRANLPRRDRSRQLSAQPRNSAGNPARSASRTDVDSRRRIRAVGPRSPSAKRDATAAGRRDWERWQPGCTRRASSTPTFTRPIFWSPSRPTATRPVADRSAQECIFGRRLSTRQRDSTISRSCTSFSPANRPVRTDCGSIARIDASAGDGSIARPAETRRRSAESLRCRSAFGRRPSRLDSCGSRLAARQSACAQARFRTASPAADWRR